MTATTYTYDNAFGLGSVMAIIDEKGNIVQSYEYSASGEEISGGDAVNQFRFVGGYGVQYDNDTKLHYMWNRWYDSSTGRFLSEDPIREESDSLNYYLYAGNRPTTLIDPNGLAALSYEQMVPLVASNNRSCESDPLIICQAWMESRFDPSLGNAHRGLLQIGENETKSVGYNWGDMYDPALNIQAGTTLLRGFIQKKGSVSEGLLRYRGRRTKYAERILNCEKCFKNCNGDKSCLGEIGK